MNILNKLLAIVALSSLIACTSACAQRPEQGDMYITGYTPSTISAEPFTVIDADKYQQTVALSRLKVQQLLGALKSYRTHSKNEQVAHLSQQLSNIPYVYVGAMGEGDWISNSFTYQPGAVHLKQDPVYRLDALDCQTFVQVAMALLYSKNLPEFDQQLLKISYGAARTSSDEIIHYYNRNNFVDGDWNPINQQQGWLRDVTSQGILAPYAKTTSANITRQNWFSYQQQNLGANVRVLNETNGLLMATRFTTVYSKLNFPHFDSETVSIAYLPKETLAIRQSDGSYQPNHDLLNQIPTPAVIEIIRDVKKWNIGGKNIKDVIGTELNVSHLGLLYRQTFYQGDLIYRKIACHYDDQHQKVCHVIPVTCQKKQCHELMFAHATDAYPNGYYWYQQTDGNYTCSPHVPAADVNYTTCNRVEQRPLFDYLTDFQYGSYSYMNSPSIVGVHIEGLS